MIFWIVYWCVHFMFGALAAVGTIYVLRDSGYDSGCLLAICGFVSFLFWPFALATLLIVVTVDALFDNRGRRGGGGR